MKKLAFTKENISDFRVIMTIMRVPVEELLCWAATGWIPVLKYLMSGARWHLGSCHVVPGIK
jgi:hypothetical protein